LNQAPRRDLEHSRGIPREANILADNSLLLAYLRKMRNISRKLIEDAARERRETIGCGKEKA